MPLGSLSYVIGSLVLFQLRFGNIGDMTGSLSLDELFKSLDESDIWLPHRESTQIGFITRRLSTPNSYGRVQDTYKVVMRSLCLDWLE